MQQKGHSGKQVYILEHISAEIWYFFERGGGEGHWRRHPPPPLGQLSSPTVNQCEQYAYGMR